MASQPTKENIDYVMSVCEGLTYAKAISRLKNNSNDPGQAINDFYDNPGGNDQWDEAAWAADRNDFSGATQSNGLQIHSSDYQNHGAQLIDGIDPLPPTRPPSRADNSKDASPQTGSQAADTHVKINQHQNRVLTQEEREDEELQKAIELSKMDPQYNADEAELPKFGPVGDSNTHDNNQWQMVPYGVTNVDYSDSNDAQPDPSDRKRQPGHPAFLRPATQKHRLPALITILHQIPLARELFLNKDDIAPDYGSSPAWWRGKEIQVQTDLPRLRSERAAMPVHDALSMELQRLMAFLDKTQRSYGSAIPLYKFTRDYEGDLADEETFFKKWRANRPAEVVARLFSTAVEAKDGVQPDAFTSKEFAILNDLPRPASAKSDTIHSFYDVIDDKIWDDKADTPGDNLYLSHIADVVCFNLRYTADSKPIEVPHIWYPDRYLKENADEVLTMRVQRIQLNKILSLNNDKVAKLTHFTMKSGRRVKVSELMEQAVKCTSAVYEGDEAISDSEGGESNMSVDPSFDLPAELTRILEKIDDKLKVLARERESTIAAMKELSNSMFTTPTHENPLRPYSLRGVSIDKNTTYIRCRVAQDLNVPDDDAAEVPTKVDQWWKITFTASARDNKPVNIMEVSDGDVTAAIIKSKANNVLVYASDHAMSCAGSALPQTLETFVNEDNYEFQREFPSGSLEVDAPSRPTSPSPRSPSKRRISQIEDVENGSRGNMSTKTVQFADEIDIKPVEALPTVEHVEGIAGQVADEDTVMDSAPDELA